MRVSSVVVVVVVVPEECVFLLVRVSLSSTQFRLNVPFEVRCGVYNLPTTRQSEQPPRATFSLVALSPTLSKNTHYPHPNFPSAPGAHLAVRRAKRSVLIFLSECQPSDNTERTFPMAASNCWICIYRSPVGTYTSSWWLCVCYRTRLSFPPSSA